MPLNEPTDFEKVLQDAEYQPADAEVALPEIPLCTTENCRFENAALRQDTFYAVVSQAAAAIYTAIGTLQAHGETIGPLLLRKDMRQFLDTVDTYLQGVGFYARHSGPAEGETNSLA